MRAPKTIDHVAWTDIREALADVIANAFIDRPAAREQLQWMVDAGNLIAERIIKRVPSHATRTTATRSTIAKRYRSSSRTIRRHIEALEQANPEIVADEGGGRGRPRLYFVDAIERLLTPLLNVDAPGFGSW